MATATSQPPRPGSGAAAVPSFDLATLEALARWRHALRARAEWRRKYQHARTPVEKSNSVQMIDRWGAAALAAERALRALVTEDA